MDVTQRRLLVLSCAAAVVGVVALELYKRRVTRELAGGDPVAVVVVTRAAPPGTKLDAELLGTRTVPEAFVERRQVRVADRGSLLGKRLETGLQEGEALLWTDLAAAASEGRTLSMLVPVGSRALFVRASAFGGLLRPGDRVDALTADGSLPPIENLLVLAVGADTGAEGDSKKRGGGSDGVTLGGGAEQMEKLANAAAAGQGALALTLRHPDDVAVSPPAPSAERLPARSVVEPRGREIEHVR